MINCLIMIDRLKRSSDLIFSVCFTVLLQCQCQGDEGTHFGVGMISADDDSVLPVLVMIKFVPRDTNFDCSGGAEASALTDYER